MRVESVTPDRADFMRHLAEDPLRNAFALYDLEEEGDRVRCYAALEGESFLGYLLAWHGRQYPNVIVTGTEEATEALLPRAPPSPCTFLLVPELTTQVDARREITAHRLMDFMVVESASFRPAETLGAEPLRKEDAEDLDALYREAVEERRDWGQWAERGIAYGIRREERLVAAAGTHFVSSRCSLIGGVYTSPPFRRQGYAGAVTSAVTEDALRRGDRWASWWSPRTTPPSRSTKRWATGKRSGGPGSTLARDTFPSPEGTVLGCITSRSRPRFRKCGPERGRRSSPERPPSGGPMWPSSSNSLPHDETPPR